MAMEYNAILKLQKKFVCVAMYFLVMSPYSYSHDFL